MVGRVCLLCLWEEGKGGEMEIVHVLPWTAHLVVCLMRYEGFFVPSSSSNISPAPSRSTRTFVSSEIGSTKTNLRLPLSFSLSRWQCSKNGCLLKKKKVAFDFFFTSISNDLTTKWFKEFVSSSPVSLRPPLSEVCGRWAFDSLFQFRWLGSRMCKMIRNRLGQASICGVSK